MNFLVKVAQILVFIGNNFLMFERSVLNELFIFVKSKLGIYFDDYEVLLLRRVSEPFAA